MTYVNSPSSRSLRGLFIAGTDTGVGKTTFSRGLLRALYNRQQRPVPFKPVETGVTDPLFTDARALQQAARSPRGLNLICPYSFASPVAPVVAARALGIELSVQALANACPKGEGPVIVESAGGLLSPISKQETNADLAAALGLPIILVGRNGLGTINHCALAVAELRRRHLNIAALVLVAVTPPGPDASTNAACISDLCGLETALTLPYAPDATDDQLAAFISSSPDLEGLMDRLHQDAFEL